MVDGFAVGAGCNIALGCDIVIASDRARFGEVFAKIGLVPDGGGTWLLPRLVGLAKAKELVFSADIIDAAEALRIGLVNRVVPAAELEATTRALAARIAAGPPGAIGLAKALLNRSATVDLGTSLGFEAYAQAQSITTDDHAEGVRAFLEKRAPEIHRAADRPTRCAGSPATGMAVPDCVVDQRAALPLHEHERRVDHPAHGHPRAPHVARYVPDAPAPGRGARQDRLHARGPRPGLDGKSIPR